jgi:hypothetical protein
MTAADTAEFLKIPSTEKVERYDIAFLKASLLTKLFMRLICQLPIQLAIRSKA